MKKRRCIIIDDEVYKEFKIYSLKKNKPISKMIEEYMERTINEISEKIKKK